MKKIVLWACALAFGTGTLFAQDADVVKKIADLKARQTELTAKATPLNTELEAIKTKLADLEKIGWKYGGTGLLGFTMTGYNNWIVGATPNNSVVSGNLNLFADYNMDPIFWLNNGYIKLGYQKIEGQNNDDYTANLDEIYASSLFGRKFTPMLAYSALVDFRSSFENFLQPAYMTAGVGLTYRPNERFYLLFHPLTWAATICTNDDLKPGFDIDPDKSLKSSFGAKLVADYKRNLLKNLVWNSNLNVLARYNDFSNPEVTWRNLFGYQFNKYFALGFDYSIRYFKPETNANILSGIAGSNTLSKTGDETYEVKDAAGALFSTIKQDGSKFTETSAAGGVLKSVDASYFQQRYIFGITATATF
ncbi:MAG: DUF3078 domain-containing protein [Sphingobacteriales bacterium]|nr:DUF3078 domain-containing protein [Sphingobacteriales bacterium]